MGALRGSRLAMPVGGLAGRRRFRRGLRRSPRSIEHDQHEHRKDGSEEPQLPGREVDSHSSGTKSVNRGAFPQPGRETKVLLGLFRRVNRGANSRRFRRERLPRVQIGMLDDKFPQCLENESDSGAFGNAHCNEIVPAQRQRREHRTPNTQYPIPTVVAAPPNSPPQATAKPPPHPPNQGPNSVAQPASRRASSRPPET